MKNRTMLLVASLLMFVFSGASADQPSPEALGAAIQDTLNNSDFAKLNVKKAVAKAFSNKIQFLDIAYSEPSDESNEEGWSAKYDLNYAPSGGGGFSTSTGRAVLESYSTSLNINGKYSFDESTNTEDYSKINLAFSYVSGDFGPLNLLSKPTSVSYQLCASQANYPQREAFDTDAEHHIALQQALPEIERVGKECWVQHEINKLAASRPAHVYSIDFHISHEGDQNFSNSNSAYGLRGVASWSGFPSLGVSVDRIDGAQNDARTALTDEHEYERLTVDIGYRYILSNTSNGPVTFYLLHRYFDELSAPTEVKTAGLDSFDYTSVALRFPAKSFGLAESPYSTVFIRYTDGKLPFDSKDDQAVELGFSTNIDALANLLSL